MLVKFFKNRSRGSKLKGESARKKADEFKFGYSKAIYTKTNSNSIKKSYGPKSSIEYLLREKERNQYKKIKDNVNPKNDEKIKRLKQKLDNVKILRGDPIVSLKLGEYADFKFENSYTAGCLAIQEKNLDDKNKKEIMNSFEELVFTGIDYQNRNILWVEHTDKKNLELNFFIANIEPSTDKNFVPYLHKTDKRLFANWRDLINENYNLSNPLDPKKKQSLIENKRIPKDVNTIRNTVHSLVEKEVEAGKLTNREEVIKFIKRKGYKVARTTKQNISIKNPNGTRNIRLSGEYYKEEFLRQVVKEKSKGLLSFLSKESKEIENPTVANDSQKLIDTRDTKQILDEFSQWVTARHDKHRNKYSQSDIEPYDWDNSFTNLKTYDPYEKYEIKFVDSKHKEVEPELEEARIAKEKAEEEKRRRENEERIARELREAEEKRKAEEALIAKEKAEEEKRRRENEERIARELREEEEEKRRRENEEIEPETPKIDLFM
ncbi:relaxase/mobilization nuclease domain-containing protein [Taylorella equigenitalis]|uniref:relaxase/mobilization nuclease domain-containing protein n=1 Tax=Taylorella equigenitalis TaxID=29575 RepID=UPI000BAC8666|nr:relaxase/mobilization nuclease domain-containing protein [Taylorella equigenitalis]ASY39390.1 hypothetical protein CA604_04540 [Taylorella equigenitalis]